MLIIRRLNCINKASGIVTLAQVARELATCAPKGHLETVTIPDAVIIQFNLLMMSMLLLETYKGKAVPSQAWSGPECSRNLRFPDYMKTAQDGGKVVSLTHRPSLPLGNAPGTHFC
jgi:hypothetical protein